MHVWTRNIRPRGTPPPPTLRLPRLNHLLLRVHPPARMQACVDTSPSSFCTKAVLVHASAIDERTTITLASASPTRCNSSQMPG